MTLVGGCGHRFLVEVDAGWGQPATFHSPLRVDLRERTRQRLLALGATATLTGGALGADLDVTYVGALTLGLSSTVLAPKPSWRDRWDPAAVASSDELFRLGRVAVEFALPAEHALDGRAAAFFRDGALVRRLRAAGGALLAWWDGRPSGTSHAVRLARDLRVPVEVLEPRPRAVAGYDTLDVGPPDLARLLGARAAVVTVNAAGIFGAGLAARAVERWPACVAAYARHRRIRREEAEPLPWRTPQGTWLLLLPTKHHPSDKRSDLDLITRALDLLPQVYGARDPLTCPALGCHLGGLEWATVYPLLVERLSAVTRHLSLQWPLPRFAR